MSDKIEPSEAYRAMETFRQAALDVARAAVQLGSAMQVLAAEQRRRDAALAADPDTEP